MRCIRCQGCMIDDFGDVRCLNCGHRPCEMRPALADERKLEGNMAIGGTCSKNGCEEKAAEDSVQCPTHRDRQRAANAKYQGRAVDTRRSARKPNGEKVALGGGACRP